MIPWVEEFGPPTVDLPFKYYGDCIVRPILSPALIFSIIFLNLCTFGNMEKFDDFNLLCDIHFISFLVKQDSLIY